MWVGVVSIFPETFDVIRTQGVVARALSRGVLSLEIVTPRDYTTDRHRTVDDRPYGGGPGMLMKAEPLEAALRDLRGRAPATVHTVYMSPAGAPLTQGRIEQLAELPAIVFIAGRYEGVDERVLETMVDEELSLGDYVVTGGELPTMIVIDAVARHLPGTLGNAESIEAESHRDGLLDCPHYTRPESLDGRTVPTILLSGDHEGVRRWRKKMRLGRTYERRPDLLARRALTVEERALLEEFFNESHRVRSTEREERV
jgi:tRNA (guanine37-N1)-methyltransferase